MAYHNRCSHDHPTFPNLPLGPEIKVLQKRFVRSKFSPLVNSWSMDFRPGSRIRYINLPRQTGEEMRANHPKTHHRNDTLLITAVFQNLLGFFLGLQIQLRKGGSLKRRDLTHTRNAWAKKQNLFSLFLRQKHDMTAQNRSLVGWWGASGRWGLVCSPKKKHVVFQTLLGSQHAKSPIWFFLKEDSPKLTQIDQNVWFSVWSKIFSYARHAWCNIQLHDLNSKSDRTHV